MKILELRFKNLNSLYGEWLIDFTATEYTANGIFALTGPTGAGKSTILDAICLALYGATPRLGKITKNANEIMSRQTGDCYAEVLFESRSGRFRSHFSQHRARKKAAGDLQNPRHEIAEGFTNGRVIEHQLRRTAAVIEEKTGMDFERFTRSILLAQGGFDTFLKADDEQKSKILEQITGTGIYSEISRRVHERQRDEREKLDRLKAAVATIIILEPEQVTEIQQELFLKRKQEIEVAAQAAETARGIAWFAAINGLKKDISRLTEEELKLQRDLAAFRPDRSKLERAVKAAALEGLQATLTAVRRQQTDDQTALETNAASLPALELSARTQAQALKSAEQKTVKARERLNAAAPLIRKIRSLDQKLAEQKREVAEAAAAGEKAATKIDADQQIRLQEQKKRNQAEKKLKLADAYLKEQSQDEWLISGLAGVEEQLHHLLSKRGEIEQKNAELKKADAALQHAAKLHADNRSQSGRCQLELDKTAINLRRSQDALSKLLAGRNLREYRNEKESRLREMAYLKRIEELEDYRARLEDGKPCPLCGAKEHPFAEGNVPLPDEIEQKIETLNQLISKADQLENANKKLAEREVSAQKNLTESEKLEAAAANYKKSAEQAREQSHDDLKNLRTAFAELRQAVLGKLRPLGITEIPETQITALLDALKSRLKAWQNQVSKKAKIEKQLADFDSEINRLSAIIETQSSALFDKQKELKQRQKEYATSGDQRQKLYGNKNPEAEELRLNRAAADAEAAEKQAGKLHSELQQRLTAAKTRIESLKKQLSEREPQLKKAETDLITALEPAGFADAEQFLAARLPSEKREELAAKAGNLDQAQTELKARQKDCATRLENEIGKKVTDKNPAELEPQLKQYEKSRKELIDAIAGIEHRLRENRAAGERIKEKQAAIATQKKEWQRWDKLHSLIGSADGKKYRNFAQGLTFELMVSHANRQLTKMNDRYLLIRDNIKPLELNVVDNYQAGEIRSTRNLSGGESFIVSLTLALGLSQMASRKVRVDSLFLDEGFGTLDEESLETSLETLSGLQQNGKLIGIISHVSGLKERIRTQITITPTSGGRSTITGPGCNRVGDRQ